MTADPRRDRLEELLVLEATQELSPAEATELDALLGAFPDTDPDALGRAAAAVHLALSPPPDALPAELAEKLRRTAAPSAVPAPPRARPARAMWAGWAVAAGLAGVLVYTNRPKPEPTLAERRAALANAVAYTGTRNGASGKIVWSDAKQEGYLEVSGLPPVDPAAGTYQLWIVDGERTDPNHKQPVDGGVFRVNPDGTALVPVRAPVRVKSAAAFAITRENDPHGVVVSKEEHLVVLTPKKPE
jgi:hypothetical protein